MCVCAFLLQKWIFQFMYINHTQHTFQYPHFKCISIHTLCITNTMYMVYKQLVSPLFTIKYIYTYFLAVVYLPSKNNSFCKFQFITNFEISRHVTLALKGIQSVHCAFFFLYVDLMYVCMVNILYHTLIHFCISIYLFI